MSFVPKSVKLSTTFAILACFVVVACQTTTLSQPAHKTERSECAVSNEAEFQSAAGIVKSAILEGTTYRSVTFSKCGYLTAHGSVGKGQYAFNQLHAKIGDSTHFVEIRARSSMNGMTVMNLSSIALPSGAPNQRNRIAIAKIGRLNEALSTLSKQTLKQDISVESNASQLARARASQEESRRQIDARNRLLGGLMSTGTQPAPSTSASTRSCRVPCSASGGDFSKSTLYNFTVPGSSRSAAKGYVYSNHPKLCRSIGLKSVPHSYFCD